MTSFSNIQSGPKVGVEMAIDKFTQATLHPDKQKLDKLLSENVSYGHSSGLVHNKAQIIDNLINGLFKFLKIDFVYQSIKLVNDVALARQIINVDYLENGVNGKYKLRVILIWRIEKKQWKLLARQANKL